MRLLICALIVTCNFIANAQELKPLTVGLVHKLYSPTLKEVRSIYIHLPADYHNKKHQKQYYPVIYVLDAEEEFLNVTTIVEHLSSTGNMPESIVVGITNPNRVKDFTPSKMSSGLYLDSLEYLNSGGAEMFTGFLKRDLIPFINKKFNTLSYRILIGKSLGGLYSINTLLHHKELFNSYISIDPALWWNDEKLNSQAKEILPTSQFSNRKLYIAPATAFKNRFDTIAELKKRNRITNAKLSVFDFLNILREFPESKLQYQSESFSSEGHNSVSLLGEYNALSYVFRSYHYLSIDNLKLFTEINPHLLKNALVRKFQQISLEMNCQVLLPETLLNDIGYSYLDKKQYASALIFFMINQKYHKRSFNVYDSLGDYYRSVNQKTEAIKYYKKALAIFNFKPTKDKIRRISNH